MGGPIAVHLGIQQQLHQRQRATKAGCRQQRRHAPRVSALLSHRSGNVFPTPSYIALKNPHEKPIQMYIYIYIYYIYIYHKTHKDPMKLIHTGALLAPRSTKSCAMLRCPRSQAANKGVVRPKPILGAGKKWRDQHDLLGYWDWLSVR